MGQIHCDVAILGAGTAGLAAERHARKAGAATLLIDPLFAGTTCATVGCMPSKLLIAAANAAHVANSADAFGIRCHVTIDGAAVMRRLRAMRDAFIAATREAFEQLPDGVRQRSRGRFLAPNRLALDNGTVVTTRATVIATGAAPKIPKPFRSVEDLILTNDNLFELTSLPASVGVVGAGPLGLELAQALSRLGVTVAVYDQGDRLAGLPDPDVSHTLYSVLQTEFPILLGAEISVERRNGKVAVTTSGGGMRMFDRLLVAAGRAPNLADLDLNCAELKADEHGVPVFDAETLQCGDAPVFIAGDANHDRPVLHEASAEGTIAGYNGAHYPDLQRFRRKVPLSVVFTSPNAATIGAQLDRDDANVVCGVASYQDQGRARVMNRNAGLCRIYADARNGRLLGATLVGPEIEHLAHLMAWMVQQSATASEILDLPFYHPTVEEGLKVALRQICAAVGTAPPRDRDDGYLPGL